MAHQWQPSEKAAVIFQRWCPNVSKEKLTLKDLRFVVKALKTLSHRWEEIGMTVNVKDLDRIKRDYRGTYRRLIAVVNSWLSENYHRERDGSNAPSWWKIVDVVADDIGGDDPNLAKNIAQNWRDFGKDEFSPLALKASSKSLSCRKNDCRKTITEIVKSLQGVASKWFEIATLLGIPVDKLNAIKDDCDGSTEACLRGVVEEWLTRGYDDDTHGYPSPSVRVLVDVVEHQAGGANPALAKELAKITFEDGSTTKESTDGSGDCCGESKPSAKVGGSSPDTEDQSQYQQVHALKKPQRVHDTIEEPLCRPLAMKDLFEITKYLGDMDNEQLKKLGGALGLLFPTLGRMNTLPDEMVAAWLLRQDNVLERSSDPTYEGLAVALEEIGHNGLAKDVREQKHSKSKST